MSFENDALLLHLRNLDTSLIPFLTLPDNLHFCQGLLQTKLLIISVFI